MAQTITRAPSARGGTTASSTRVGQVTLIETSATGSRRVRKQVEAPGRRRELGDLALDPDPAEAGDPLGDHAGRRCVRVVAARARSRAARALLRHLRWTGGRRLRTWAAAYGRARTTGAPCCSPWLLRRGRPSGDHRREGARAVRRPRSTYASRSSTTSTSWRPSSGAARSSSRRPIRGARGRDGRLLRTRRRPSVHEEAAARGLKTIDATCPLVTKVHHEAKRFASEGYQILLIGHEGHEEVVGTSGEAPEHITLVDGPESAADGRGRSTPPGSPGCRRRRCRSTRPTRRSRPCVAGCRCSSTRRAMTSATPRRTVSPP